MNSFLFKIFLFKSKKSSLPVISVGNIHMGGTEKTPLVINLLTFLQKEGKRPAMVSRGYKGKMEQEGGIVSDGKSRPINWELSGDEPFMVAIQNPSAGVFVGKDRYASILKAQKLNFDIIVLDDGFQHLKLERNLDIVLFNPAGKEPLRESISSLKRAHILLLKKPYPPNLKRTLSNRFPNLSIYDYRVELKGIYSKSLSKPFPLESFHSKRFIAFCGIANPQRFFSLLKRNGIDPVHTIIFPDHHSYPKTSILSILKNYKNLNADGLITTEKDIIKLSEGTILNDIPLYFAKINLETADSFYKKIEDYLK